MGVNGLVGAMVGQERTLVPLLADEVFGVGGIAAVMSFVLAFGLAKAATNLVAGALADRVGRRPVLVTGWLLGVPVPLLLMFAPSWEWIIGANLLLGVNQGLTWSTTLLMKLDLVGPVRRGFATGLNEAAGYVAVAFTALATGVVAAHVGLRPAPFFIGLACAGLGLGASVLFVRETRAHAAQEHGATGPALGHRWREVVLLTSLREPSLSAASQAGLVNNLNDGMAWGLLPLYFAAAGLGVEQVAILAAAYPATWGLAQVVTGALSDRTGRKLLVVAGMLLQAVAIGSVAAGSGFVVWFVAAVGLGLGTAMVYPTLLAVVADVARPAWRGSALGVYRLWRDLGFAVGALLSGFIADAFGLPAAIWSVAAVTALSGMVVLVRMAETRAS